LKWIHIKKYVSWTGTMILTFCWVKKRS